MSGRSIAVFGAGAAGLACAIAAARRGASVHLVEKTSSLGGTVVHSLIHTIGGLYDEAGGYVNEGLPVESAELLLRASTQTAKRKIGKLWTLSVDPETYQAVIEHWIGRHANITVLRDSYAVKIHTDDLDRGGVRITQVDLVRGNRLESLPFDAVVDATGSAEVVRLVDPALVADGDSLAGLIFQIRSVRPNALVFPRNIGVRRQMEAAVEAGVLPAVFARTWLDVGVSPTEIYAKANLPSSAYDAEAVQDWGLALMACLRQIPDFAESELARVGRLGLRDGGRIRGEYCLTVDDVKGGVRFTDSVGRGAWPIEYWSPEKGVVLDYLPEGHAYEIPLRSLKVAGVTNLWAAGKCLSAEKLAQASARVAGTCWAMGEGLGQAICEIPA